MSDDRHINAPQSLRGQRQETIVLAVIQRIHDGGFDLAGAVIP